MVQMRAVRTNSFTAAPYEQEI